MMKDANGSLKRNILMNAFLKTSSIIFPLITFPYVSRILLPEGTGKVAFATSVISYFALFAQLGIPTYGIRACAKVRDDQTELSRTTQELLIINLVMSMVVYAVLIMMLISVPTFRKERPLYLVVSLTILFNAIGVEWLYKGLEQYTYITIRSFFFKLIALISMFLFIRRESDYVLYGGLSILAASASNVLNFVHARKLITLRPVGGYHFKKHLKAVAIFFAMSCATTIYTHIDSTMLGFMISDTAVGYYDAAVKVRTALLGVVTSLGAVLLPRASYYIQHGRYQDFMSVSRKAMNFVILFATPVMAFFILFAKPSIYVLSGPSYYGAVLPMQLILPTVLLVGVTNILGIQMLVPLGQEIVVLYSEIAGAATDLIINAILIPFLGACGAAIGTLAAEAVVLLVQVIGLKNKAIQTLRGLSYGKTMISVVLAAMASGWIGAMQLGSLMTLLFGACLFFGSYGLLLLLMKEPMVEELWDQAIGILRKGIHRRKRP